METIIGLLFILLPVIFKLIGKKIENGSWVQEVMDETESEAIQPEIQPETQPEVQPQPQVWHQSLSAPAPVEEATASVIDYNEYMRKRSEAMSAKKPAKRAPVLVEEERKPKEKIDPKKLVIYSEIMSPKYKE